MVGKLNTLFVQVLHICLLTTLKAAKLHNASKEFRRSDYGSLNVRFLGSFNLSLWIVGRVVHKNLIAAGRLYPVLYARSRKNNNLVKITLKTLLHNLQMKQAQEATAESVSKGKRIVLFVNKGSIVQLQLLKSIFKLLILSTIFRINTTEYHRTSLLVSRKRLIT